jgi:hypothetical protein
MGVRITIDNLVPAGVPPGGIIVKYKPKGTGSWFTRPTFFALPIIIDTTDPAGTLYDIAIQRDCGDIPWSTEYFTTTPCNCTDGTYSLSPEGDHCEKVQSVAPTIFQSDYCLATSVNAAYSGFESRMYAAGFTDSDIGMAAGTPVGGKIIWRSTTGPQWANPTANINLGPMNRCSVWIDSDCNGTPNGLAVGQQTTIAFAFVNSGTTRTIYVGVGADNMFKLIVNGTQVAACGQPATPTSGSQIPFKIWHIIPITIKPGQNFINVVGQGDGTVNDAVGMVVYDNTSTQIMAATADSQLNILYTTATLRGSSYSVATCPDTYSLDTSAGEGNYVCRKILTKVCNSIS